MTQPGIEPRSPGPLVNKLILEAKDFSSSSQLCLNFNFTKLLLIYILPIILKYFVLGYSLYSVEFRNK